MPIQEDEVYLAYDVLVEKPVVLKLEAVEGNNHTLEHEFDVYKKLEGGTGIPVAHFFCVESGFYAMTIDCLGPSLEDLFTRCHFRFSIKTVLLLSTQLVSGF
jgi:casein kinase 1/casein kinase I family protein HRR25